MWIKHYIDGTEYKGDIFDPNTSWRNSRNKGIVGVSLYQNNQKVIIRGLGEYWQGDQFIVPVGSPQPAHIKSFVQRRVEPWEKVISLSQPNTNTLIAIFNQTLQNQIIIPITTENINKYFTVEVDIITSRVKYYFCDRRV